VGFRQLECGSNQRASAPNAYRPGDEGRQMGEGQSPPTSADPLIQRQSACRATSDGKLGQKNLGRRRRNLDYAQSKDESHRPTSAARISTKTAEAGLYPKKFRQNAPSGYPDMGCTLPPFPGDVRDSMCLPPGGSEPPIHHSRVTVPQITAKFKWAVASTAA
jgi:hypothetical protein